MTTNDLRGNIWLFFRDLLQQGVAIAQDDAAGQYPTYEEFAQRISIAASERMESAEWQAIETALKGQGEQ